MGSMDFRFENQSSTVLSNFALKFNANTMGVAPGGSKFAGPAH
jgi:hypothetical protein